MEPQADKSEANATIPTTDTAPEKGGVGQDNGVETFTQEDLNRIVGERAARAAETARVKLLEELGLDSTDALKALVEDARKRRESEMTEAEKAQAEAEAARKEAADAKAALEKLKAEQAAKHRASTVQNALRKSGGHNVDDLFILINAKQGDAVGAIFDDSNAVDADRLAAFVKQVQADYPSYFGSAGAGSPSNAGGLPPTSRAQAAINAQDEIARKFGKL